MDGRLRLFEQLHCEVVSHSCNGRTVIVETALMDKRALYDAALCFAPLNAFFVRVGTIFAGFAIVLSKYNLTLKNCSMLRGNLRSSLQMGSGFGRITELSFTHPCLIHSVDRL